VRPREHEFVSRYQRDRSAAEVNERESIVGIVESVRAADDWLHLVERSRACVAALQAAAGDDPPAVFADHAPEALRMVSGGCRASCRARGTRRPVEQLGASAEAGSEDRETKSPRKDDQTKPTNPAPPARPSAHNDSADVSGPSRFAPVEMTSHGQPRQRPRSTNRPAGLPTGLGQPPRDHPAAPTAQRGVAHIPTGDDRLSGHDRPKTQNNPVNHTPNLAQPVAADLLATRSKSYAAFRRLAPMQKPRSATQTEVWVTSDHPRSPQNALPSGSSNTALSPIPCTEVDGKWYVAFG
jgi:hypothetical protein